jgi:hypothetical protein
MQKKIIIGCIMFLSACMLMTNNGFAQCATECTGKKVLESDGFCYKVRGKKKVYIVGYTGPGGHVIIPPTINGLSVMRIRRNAFRACENITKVTIPFSVTIIDRHAFADCPELRCVLISDSVKKIGRAAFRNCARLTYVLIGNSVKKIQKEAFWDCPLLKYVYFRGIAPRKLRKTFGPTDEPLNICVNNCVGGGCVSDDDCGPGDLCSCAALFECVDETLISLGSFEAVWQDEGVNISWYTDVEIDNAYFNIYRAESEDGPWDVPVNIEPIAAEGEPPSGAAYNFFDDTVQSGLTYWYLLEDVDTWGASTFHGPCGPVNEEFSCSFP